VNVTTEPVFAVALLAHTFVAVNVDVGVSCTVTVTLVNGDVHAGLPGLTTINESVLMPVVPQLNVYGPAVVPGALTQPSQTQLYVAPATAVPVKFTTVVPFVVEGLAHTDCGTAPNVLVGVAFTVTCTVVVVDWHVGLLLFVTINVNVFVPTLFQLTVYGPDVVPGVPLQPSQTHVYVAPAAALPV